MEPFSLPVVPGLEFRVVDRTRRTEIIRGATLATAMMVVRVTPQVAGTFTIPGITPPSQPLVLRVSPNSGNPNGGIGASGKALVLAGGASANGIRMSADGSAFIRMSVPKRDVYVGESVPVAIEVGMRAGFVNSLNGLPTLAGSDEFTLNNLSRQPERNATDHRRQTLYVIDVAQRAGGGQTGHIFSHRRVAAHGENQNRPAARSDARGSAR